jgi:hypothetical protein
MSLGTVTVLQAIQESSSQKHVQKDIMVNSVVFSVKTVQICCAIRKTEVVFVQVVGLEETVGKNVMVNSMDLAAI